MLPWGWADHVSVRQDLTTLTRYPTGVVPINSLFKPRRDSFRLVEISSRSVSASLNQLLARRSAPSLTYRSCIIFGDNTPLESATRSSVEITTERATAV